MKRRSFLCGGAALCFSGPAAQGNDVATGDAISSAKAFSGGRFYAGEQEFLLADIIAPSAYTLGGGAPFFDDAKSKLNDLLTGAKIETEEVDAPTRWGGLVVHARRRGDAQTLQELLVADGAARVAPQSVKNDYIGKLLALEENARDHKSGLWRLDAYNIVPANNATGAIGAYHLIEGHVRKTAKVGSRFYLNFGDDYRFDFTAGARSALQRRWASDGLDLAGLAGAHIRVRGFVDNINGPSIDLEHIKQIEILF